MCCPPWSRTIFKSVSACAIPFTFARSPAPAAGIVPAVVVAGNVEHLRAIGAIFCKYC